MTKADIVNEIARTTDIDKVAVLSAVEQFMSVVKDSLAIPNTVLYLRKEFLYKIWASRMFSIFHYPYLITSVSIVGRIDNGKYPNLIWSSQRLFITLSPW